VGRVLSLIDAVSTAAGWLAGWLFVPMTLAVAYEVTARYVFNPAGAWTSRTCSKRPVHAGGVLHPAQGGRGPTCSTSDGRRRRRSSTRSLRFFFPGLAFVFYAGAVEARQAWAIGERSAAGPLYPFKAVIPLTAALLLLQGLSELIKCARLIRGPRR
jgi:TRAP-type mannitol/chloroaromatic compound transport system permease small subunit